MSDEVIKYIFECIIEYALETTKTPRNEFNAGKRLAYYEILNCVYNQLEINDINPADYGLSFDPDDIL